VPVVDDDPTGQRFPGRTLERRELPPAAAKVRILNTADRLFYDEGIRAVGVDRLISESSVTKATFYKHYGSKDRLVVEYMRRRHELTRQYLDGLRLELEPQETLERLVQTITEATQKPGFRGCPFVNAAAEFLDARHPVRVVVTEHRDWYTETLADLLGKLGHPLPGDASDELLLARDGAMTGAHVGDPIASAAAFQRAVARVLSEARG
jgi:AcrR family transcriptional regulator